ncbi:MAG TPA: alpha/beta hydrolase [Steroidobacteraceae bacterium]|jgi:pimeloyl-ACP methyl ester carboxylesterase|nr:alpha/beta hydrolase [Steroidobacteraceae bacterium]
MPTDILTFGERRIEYRFALPAAGGGIDIVMLHEGLGSTSLWRDFPERLAAATGSRTLVYSRLGYGRSTPLTEPRGVDYMHEEARIWLPAILERLDIRRPVLFGHSDGASISLIHAARPESRIAAVVALAPHVKVEDVTVRNIAEAKTAYAGTDLRQRLARHHADVDSAFWGWNRIWLSPEFRGWNIEALLPSIRCPVLAIQGEDDEYGTMEQIASIGRGVPDASLLALPACRHSPHRDQPEAVLDAAKAFIAALPPQV